MFCSKCGALIENGQKFCSKCGSPVALSNDNLNKKISKKNKLIILGIGISIFISLILLLLIFKKDDYYFSNDVYGETSTKGNNVTTKKGKYTTSIIYDHMYEGVKIDDKKDAIKLIEKDSLDQKNKCSEEILEIEKRIINNYGITAVNLCEMDREFALELENVVKTIYNEYPTARGYLTNLSLANTTLKEGYIAAFFPSFKFATSSNSSTYPWVMKTQILLNSSYFLNIERIEASTKDGSQSGQFPKNTTKYSPLAHEFGHYLSFIAMIDNYNFDSMLLISNNNYDTFLNVIGDFSEGNFSLKMIEEAYNNYKLETNTSMTLLEFRESISKYAVAKDNEGNYIYDETIAEAFHDYYLNKENAAAASKEIVKVLKKYLEKAGA